MFKRFISLFVMVLLLVNCFSVVSFAEEESENKVVFLDADGNEIMPCWDYVSTTAINLSFGNGRVYMDANISGDGTCSYITARAQLEKKDSNGNYQVVITYLDLSSQGTDAPYVLNIHKNRLAEVNDNYRFTVYATVYGKDGGSEPITIQTTGTYYP